MNKKLTVEFWTELFGNYPKTFDGFLIWYKAKFNDDWKPASFNDAEQFGIVWLWSCEVCKYKWEMNNYKDFFDEVDLTINEVFENEETPEEEPVEEEDAE